MVYVTGDFHGDLSRFNSKALKKLKKNDTLIICGDFGFIWDGNEKEQKQLKWIGNRPYHVLFVEGTHENLQLLSQYPTESWGGGLTHVISGKLRHLIRGELFSLPNEDLTVLALGGGQPEDGEVIRDGVLPTKEETMAIMEKLQQTDWNFDLIVSHQAPTNIDGCICHKFCDVSFLTALMDSVQKKAHFKHWCFGSYHVDKTIPTCYHALYSTLFHAGGKLQKKALFSKA